MKREQNSKKVKARGKYGFFRNSPGFFDGVRWIMLTKYVMLPMRFGNSVEPRRVRPADCPRSRRVLDCHLSPDIRHQGRVTSDQGTRERRSVDVESFGSGAHCAPRNRLSSPVAGQLSPVTCHLSPVGTPLIRQRACVRRPLPPALKVASCVSIAAVLAMKSTTVPPGARRP